MPISEINQRDLFWTNDGDFLIDPAGDLRDTEDAESQLEGLRQQILHRLIAEVNGWRRHPEICAGLERWIGDAIDDQLISQIEDRILEVLTFDGTLQESEFSVQALEIIQGILAIQIYINTVQDQQKPLVTMTYNMQSTGILQVR